MPDPFIGEIRLFAGNFAPVGWAFCDGQLLSISQYSALFSLLGTMYGGNGQTTFALPDLRGRVPMHWGQGPGLTPRVVGEAGGTEAVQLQPNQMPAHNHSLNANTTDGNVRSPSNATLAHESGQQRGYTSSAPNTTMAPQAIGNAGGSQPHPNLQPYLTVSFIIALDGVYPSRA